MKFSFSYTFSKFHRSKPEPRILKIVFFFLQHNSRWILQQYGTVICFLATRVWGKNGSTKYIWYIHFYYILTSKVILTMQFTWGKQENQGFQRNFTYIFFFFLAVEILRLSNAGKFCISKNIVLFVIDFGRELCFLFSYFFIFHANSEFKRAPCQLPKMKFSVFCITFSSLILASFGSFSCLNASYAKKYQSWYISMIVLV